MNASAHSTAWLFPGQGSQFVGMGRELLAEFAPAVETLALASELVGVDLAKIVARGPESELVRTDYLQPALTAINLGCCLLLAEHGVEATAVAGHSLGEFAALFAAGVLTRDNTLRLVAERGRLMHEIARTVDGGMLAVKGLSIEVVTRAMVELSPDQVIGIANHNTPVQIVISGERAALARAAGVLAELGGLTVSLNVSGPWHSSLLAPAAAQFRLRLNETEFEAANVPVIMNVSGEALSSAAEILAAMERQLCSPVRWVQVMRTLYARGVRRFVEVGPGKVLRGLIRGMPELVGCEVVNFDSPRALRHLAESMAKKGSV